MLAKLTWKQFSSHNQHPTSKDITVKSSAQLKLKFLIDFCCLLLYYVTVKSTMLLLGFYNQQPLSSREAKAGNWQTQDYQTELQGDQTRPDDTGWKHISKQNNKAFFSHASRGEAGWLSGYTTTTTWRPICIELSRRQAVPVSSKRHLFNWHIVELVQLATILFSFLWK